jgi:type I restriction enzyme M protein
MKHGTRPGSRIAEVHNGSSLFTGDAGQGESNIRRWIIENDWLEAIIALPKTCSTTPASPRISGSSPTGNG